MLVPEGGLTHIIVHVERVIDEDLRVERGIELELKHYTKLKLTELSTSIAG